jgi:hypothetical protein
MTEIVETRQVWRMLLYLMFTHQQLYTMTGL